MTPVLINLEFGLLPLSPLDEPVAFPKIVTASVMVLPGSEALHSSFLRLQLGDTLASCTPFVKKCLEALDNLSQHTAITTGYFFIPSLYQSSPDTCLTGFELILANSVL